MCNGMVATTAFALDKTQDFDPSPRRQIAPIVCQFPSDVFSRVVFSGVFRLRISHSSATLVGLWRPTADRTLLSNRFAS